MNRTCACVIDAALISIRSSYSKEVYEAGFSLDLESIKRGYIVRLSKVAEGKRNNRLFRYAVECVRCGIDPHALTPAAMRSGLSSQECEKTIRHAFDDFSDQYGETVLDKTIVWQEKQKPLFENRFHLLIEQVAKQAVAQNTLKPMINQGLLKTGVDRTTISRRLDALCERGALRKIPMGNKKNSPQRRCNCYELINTNHVTGEVSVPSTAATVSSLPFPPPR